MSYLKPMRRKIGVLTLIIACVIAAGWVRSYIVGDFVTIMGDRAIHNLSSLNGSTAWTTEPFDADFSEIPLPSRFLWQSAASQPQWPGQQSLNWEAESENQPISKIWRIPYWTIVIPLTLLSAWLLLSKPRTEIPKKTGEPSGSSGS